ncbi:OmpA family protein [uncultured Stenotrophomonas sp.]|uniref:OmpA family protein n=1 Tax=uncultured Stenotrophomonas sp. TaxID=165438 RepID=UPI0028E27036|nr:OmpA family protein [uncultured Stenotrophomonas sp.]
MSTFDTVVQQVAKATGLGDGAQQFIKVLAGYIFKQSGGVSGLLQKFENAGLGDIAKSWTAGNATIRPIDASQIRSVIGNEALDDIAQKAGVNKGLVPAFAATALPVLVRALTSGGAMPATMPASFAGLINAAPRRKKPFHLWRWLLPLLALLALAYCGWQKRNVLAPPPVATPTATLAPAATVPSLSFKNTGGKIDLSGVVSTTAEKASLIGAAAGAVGQKNVTANVEVNPAVSPASWLDSLKALIAAPLLKSDGLAFKLNGDKLELDTSKLPTDKRAELSQLFQNRLGNVEIKGLYQPGLQALAELQPGFGEMDLTNALNQTSVTFTNNSDAISTSSLAVISEAAKAIKAAPAGMKIDIGGYTDSNGDDSSNLALSERRAKSVMKALVDNGVPAGQLKASGHGESDPIADNSTEAGRAANRRTVYTVY